MASAGKLRPGPPWRRRPRAGGGETDASRGGGLRCEWIKTGGDAVERNEAGKK
jgi:hypothetical protein